MYLEKLEIQGFKSFAHKNVLVFPGMLDKSRRGITAIVGPNGSGKSNVADAVRWALGEQSMKTLRGKRAEDVIFSGSDRKGKLGMAEVSLFLNNEDHCYGGTGNKALIDYSQIVVTRRLYRNGDSEYMINNNRVRLADIQMMLAKAKFGQKTYSVIGQGMVEGFLNTTLAERKEFFDEATGVKQYQIRRDESLNKLRASYENLIQAQMLLAEIEPRLKSLTRQVNRLRKRGEIEGQLKELQLKYYSKLWHEINDKFSDYNKQYLELEKEKFTKDKKLAGLNQELGQLETKGGQENKFIRWQNDLSKAQNEKDEINKKLAKIEAQMELKLEANGQFDLSFLLARKEEINREIKNTREEIETLEKNIGYDKEKSKELNKEREGIEKKINELDSDLMEIGYEKDRSEVKKISSYLDAVLDKLRQIDAEKDIKKIKEAILRVKDKVKQILTISDRLADKERTEAKEEEQKQKIPRSFKELNKAKENIITRINDNNLRITARSERVKLLKEKIIKLDEELHNIGDKLKQKSDRFDIDEVTSEQNELKEQLSVAEDKIKEIRTNINQATVQEEEKRSKLFSLQKDLQNLQNEVNVLNNQLSELRINSTRYETKLEDLEIEIRQELGGLKEVRENRIREELDTLGVKEKIGQLKHQLELIGGIDPQIEKEYDETKERYDFLSGQVNDLTGAVDSLGKIIEELDLIIKERFDKEYKIIASKFERYFKILFNGGNAKIIKVMEEEKIEEAELDKEEEGPEVAGKKKSNEVDGIKKIKFLQKHNATGLAGIEIQAVPPGKKIKSLAMLSGGERALTAIALICAIISANPSPFVVLDEVDAALDEANSERLAKILDELSYKTQFILITHNRATMRRANVLYGITMGDDGVSKLLSIKLDEAAKTVSSE
jgi:chromosome segregation protein